MTKRATHAAVLLLVLLSLTAAPGVEAADIEVLSTVGMQPATPQLIADFERATGHKVLVTYGLAAVLKRNFVDGLRADVLILTSPLIDELTAEGKVVPGSKVDVARSGIGIAVKTDTPKPDVSTPDALRNAVLAAKSVGYSKLGASGVAFARVMEGLGIAEQVQAKYKDTQAKAGEMLVAGDIELAAAQIPELMAVPGVEVVGPLPPGLQTITIFSVGLAGEAKNPDAAKALIRFLAGPDAAPVYKAKGLGG
jgi:molybdate transport system substrate-binding protein